jgi:hypothetical protein
MGLCDPRPVDHTRCSRSVCPFHIGMIVVGLMWWCVRVQIVVTTPEPQPMPVSGAVGKVRNVLVVFVIRHLAHISLCVQGMVTLMEKCGIRFMPNTGFVFNSHRRAVCVRFRFITFV